MNRTLYIIICDFIILSLLSLANFEQPPDTGKAAEPTAVRDYRGSQEDLMDALKLSLEEEKSTRQELTGQLAAAQDVARQTQQELTAQQKRIELTQQQLQQKEAESRRLAQEHTQLQSRYGAAQSSLSQLEQQLAALSKEASASKSQVAAVQEELIKRQEEALIAQKKLEQVEQTRQLTEAEKQKLATQLQVVETEKKMTQQQLAHAKDEIQVVRTEKAQLQTVASELAEGVLQLAQKSGELSQEIRENRPLAANFVFSEFLTNRVLTEFNVSRTGFLGREVHHARRPRTILISDGRQIYSIYHIDDTPFAMGPAGIDWEWFTGKMYQGLSAVNIERVHFLSIDPRIVVAPISATDAKALRVKIYSVSPEPYKFAEAVLVGASEGYYGECKFQIDPALPQYVRMDRNAFGKLVGKFNPSRGDMVFSKSGELLGIMVNNEYCALLTNFMTSSQIATGSNIVGQQTGQTLTLLYNRVLQLPYKLQ